MVQIFDPTNSRISELKIFNNCVSSLKSLLGELAADYKDEPWPVVQVTGNSTFRELAEQQKLVKLPFIAFIIANMRPSEEGYNDQAMYNGFGLGQVNPTGNQPTNVVMHMKPVAVDVQVLITAQDFDDITQFAQRWLFREREVQFALQTATYNLPIKVKFNEELAIPEEDFSEMGNLFVMQTQLTFYAYVGVIELQPAITKVNVNMAAANLATDKTIPIFNKIIKASN